MSSSSSSSSSTIMPPRLRAFHLPGAFGDFMSGHLHVSGPGRVLFPSSPVSTVVRTLPVAGDRILWMRSFAGTTFMQSTYRFSAAGSEQPLHDVEYLFPLSFQFDWTDPSVVVTSEDGSGGTRVSPRHIGTRLLDFVPLPLRLVSVRLEMGMLDDGGGWDLVADVRLLGVLKLICYEGTMRELETEVSAGTGNSAGTADAGAGTTPEKEAAATDSAATIGDEHSVPPPPKYVPGFHTLVLFDGVCNLCNFSVDFAMRRDEHARRLVFAPQQSPKAAEALRNAGHQPPPAMVSAGGDAGLPSSPAKWQKEDDGGDSGSVLVLTPDGVLHDRSGAALRVGLALDWPWPWLAALGFLVPTRARDAIYDWVGRNRYKWFGQKDTCRLPSASERRRFL